MRRRKKDKFMREMGSIHRARSRRKAHRNRERFLHEGPSPWGETWEDLSDGLSFRAQEFGALSKEVGRGVIRESAGLAKDFLKVGTSLALDILTGVATMGLTVQPLDTNHRRSKRRRR